MKRNRFGQELSGEAAVVAGTTYRPIAGYSATTYQFKGAGLFATAGRPLRLEIEGSDGEVTVIPIRDLQWVVLGVLLVVPVALSLLILFGRRAR